jgi:AcrR family transcriptional regulator
VGAEEKRRPGRPRTREKDAHLRRDEPIESLPPVARNLLSGARRILEREGFGALSLSAIASEADESKASIGYYFGNKDGLVVALVDSLVHEANRGIIHDTHRYPMGEQRLRALIDGERGIIEDTRSFLTLLEVLPHALRDDSLRERIADLYAGYRKTILDVLDATEGPDEARLRPYAVLMIAIVDGLSLQQSLDPDGTDLSAAIDLWRRMTRCLLKELQLVDFA